MDEKEFRILKNSMLIINAFTQQVPPAPARILSCGDMQGQILIFYINI